MDDKSLGSEHTLPFNGIRSACFKTNELFKMLLLKSSCLLSIVVAKLNFLEPICPTMPAQKPCQTMLQKTFKLWMLLIHDTFVLKIEKYRILTYPIMKLQLGMNFFPFFELFIAN